MKNPSKNPNAMKDNHESNFYFSAYPLKALNLPEEKKTYLHIYKRENKNSRALVHSKILPMTLADHEQAVKKLKEKIPPDKIEERDSEWFASYE